ncbi:MAG TPA: 50S ribosomal protein L9 [Candidatus Krumholzibacteria bacterium]|nr:50S ribosomal protein L9 [Candidatus Krumholzibacteria bacterium]
MDVILLHDVQKLGRRGAKVGVARGYARNYLFPRGLAIQASLAKERELESQLKAFETRDEQQREQAQGLAESMQGAAVTITAAAGEENLYGSVSAAMISAALEKLGHAIDAKQVILEEPLKKLGTYAVGVRVHRDIEVEVQVTIERA